VRALKKIGFLIAIVILGALDIFVYLNSHLYYRAGREEDAKAKIALLERSNKFCSLNDLVFYELGKSYFDLGLMNLSNAAVSEASFRNSVQNLKKSVLINPASPFSHFYLGQSLLNLDLVNPGRDTEYYDEFRKAAMLAGDDSQIYNEVGRLFLSRWPELSDKDRNFTLDVLRKIMAKKDSKMITLILNIWELNVKDYEVMDKVLPSDAQIYRQYAEFLGEKSLSQEERHEYLAQAELLEFERARREFQSGETQLSPLQAEEALGLFKACQTRLLGIKFYQTLTGKNLIDRNEYDELLKFTWLNLAKCRIERGNELKDVVDELSQYLALEDRADNVDKLASYLRDRGIIPEKIEQNSGDLTRLAFELLLQFKQAKYREIINFGRDLQRSFVVVPEAKKRDYVRILLLVGDSLQKVDFLYDAGDIYQKALEVDADNLETLLRIRQNCGRLNEEKRLEETNRAIEKLETPGEVSFQSASINKGESFSSALVLDGRSVSLDLQFQPDEEGESPLISVFFNGRVVWEEYLKSRVISLTLETNSGKNILQIMPLNRNVMLSTLSYRLNGENTNLIASRRQN
jgi:hypothetical protein